MNTETIIATLLAGAAFLKEPVKTVMAQSVKDTYESLKYYLRRKLGVGSEAVKALDLATDKPESEARKAVLLEETANSGLDADTDLVRLVEQLAVRLPKSICGIRQHVSVGGRHNTVQVAGRDLVTTARYVHRNAITPDDRHLTAEQRTKVGGLVTALAARLASEDGNPRFGAVHSMLQRRFNVVSYLLLPRTKFEEVLGFLRQQCAIHRSSLRSRNPSGYQHDFFRMIHARRNHLGWDKPQLYRFAADRLRLKGPIMSLGELGAHQLKSLAEVMGRQKAKPDSLASKG